MGVNIDNKLFNKKFRWSFFADAVKLLDIVFIVMLNEVNSNINKYDKIVDQGYLKINYEITFFK